jgi:hypothetical protein
MEPYVAELIGVAAAAASLYSAHAKTMVPLRVAAIVGSIELARRAVMRRGQPGAFGFASGIYFPSTDSLFAGVNSH